jgi:HSP20 family protein
MSKQLQNYDPLGDLFCPDNWDDFFFPTVGRRRNKAELAHWAPAVDISEDKEAVYIRAEIPGVERDNISINVEDGVLTLKGERKMEEEKKKDNYHRIERSYGSFTRSFTLPKTVDANAIDASLKDGVLDVKLPKREETKPKAVDIKVH